MKRPFTRLGYKKLTEELADLEKKRIEAVSNLKTAREMGDLSENAAYKVARSKLSSLDSRLRFLKKTLENAYVYEEKFDGRVAVGCFVTLNNEKGEVVYQIVNDIEADVMKGKISYYSPVGKALIGKGVNDQITVKTPKGEINYRILKVE